MIVGQFDGSKVDAVSGLVETSQFFNLSHATAVERETNESIGGSAIHEINESYFAATQFPGQGYSIYGLVHDQAKAIDSKSGLVWRNFETRDLIKPGYGFQVDYPDGTQKEFILYYNTR